MHYGYADTCITAMQVLTIRYALHSFGNVNYKFTPSVMCLYPRFIKNPKYQPNKKNNNNPPICREPRTLYVPIACGECMECRKAKAREWTVRLQEELKINKGFFVTLTFNDEILKDINQDTQEELHTYVRRFLERWRKKFKKSIRHWLITERGQDNSERLHIHGILFTDEEHIKELANIWSYGIVDIGQYCNERTINYIVKYVYKNDEKHRNFKPKLFTSAGLGRTYTDKNKDLHIYRPLKTNELYKDNKGVRRSLPIYYRNKLFTEEQRENLWIEKIDKKVRYVNGIKVDISTFEGRKLHNEILLRNQRKSEELGYNRPIWNNKKYTINLEQLNQ